MSVLYTHIPSVHKLNSGWSLYIRAYTFAGISNVIKAQLMLRTHINAEHPNALYLSVVCPNHKNYMWSGHHGVLKGWCQGHCQSIRMLNCLQRSSQYQLTKFITVIDALHFSIAQIPSKTHKSVCVHGMYWVLTKAHITHTYYMPKVLEGIYLISLVCLHVYVHRNHTLSVPPQIMVSGNQEICTSSHID